MAEEAEEDGIGKAVAALEFEAAKRGLSLTVHALKRAKMVLKWELAGDREKALIADRGGDIEA